VACLAERKEPSVTKLSVFFVAYRAFVGRPGRGAPHAALNFVVVAFVSQYFLGEVVSPLRWVGTVVICIGVFMISKSST
jgi:uncharacterized membrane protein